MGPTPGWSASDAIAHLDVDGWAGDAWRWHAAHRDASSSRGSELVSGRYLRARPQDPSGIVWRALYLGLTTGACLGEAIRYLGATGAKATRGRRLTRLRVRLRKVVDLRDVRRVGVTLNDLTQDQDWSIPHPATITQQLALAALQRGIEGLLVPAASLVDDNLVVLIDNLAPTSSIDIVSHVDPKLFVVFS